MMVKGIIFRTVTADLIRQLLHRDRKSAYGFSSRNQVRSPCLEAWLSVIRRTCSFKTAPADQVPLPSLFSGLCVQVQFHLNVRVEIFPVDSPVGNLRKAAGSMVNPAVHNPASDKMRQRSISQAAVQIGVQCQPVTLKEHTCHRDQFRNVNSLPAGIVCKFNRNNITGTVLILRDYRGIHDHSRILYAGYPAPGNLKLICLFQQFFFSLSRTASQLCVRHL